MNTTLLPSFAERARILDLAIRRLNAYWEALPARPVTPLLSTDRIADRLAQFDFTTARPMEQTLDTVFALLEEGTVHNAHPRYFGLFNPSPSFPGVLGELIAAGFNPQLAVRSHAPAAVEIEKHLIRAMGARLGWAADEAAGHFTTGGAEANMTAALCALTRCFPDYAEAGLAALQVRPVFYASRESHFAWFKIAHQLGLGRSAVRLVDTDGSGRMNTAALRSAIAADRAQGLAPFLLAATAGTTNAGMIDPLPECAAIAAEEELWLHADAAWGGGLLASDRLRGVLHGIERADSVTVDAHKWFSTPMGAGMYLSRDRDALARAFRVSASYMPSNDAAEDPYLQTAQWSRRFIGLKLFLSLAGAGWAGHAVAIEHQLAVADHLRSLLPAHGFQVVNDSPLGVVCFVAGDGGDPDRIAAQIVSSGNAWISVALFEGRRVLRACVTSFRSENSDADRLAALLHAALDEQ